MLAFALAIVGVSFVDVASAPTAHADYADSQGLGKNVRQIFWLDWSKATYNGAPLRVESPGSSQLVVPQGTKVEVSPAPGYKIVATVSRLATPAGTLNARKQDASYSDIQAIHGGTVYGYNTKDQYSRLVPRTNNLRTTFTLTFEVFRNGSSVATPGEYPTVIAADGESLNSNENISFTTSGENWTNIENVGYTRTAGSTGQLVRNMWDVRSGADTAGLEGGFNTKTFGKLGSAGKAVPIGASRNAQTLVTDINSGGREDVMIGFFVPMDHGDAPSTFGDASHVISWTTDGQPRPASLEPSIQPRIVLDSASGPFLGKNPPDAEGAVSATAWTGDDSVGDYNGTTRADEAWDDLIVSGQRTPVSCPVPQYSLKVKVGNGHLKRVSSWIDWNNNQKFDDAERAVAGVSGDTATLVWKNPVVASGATKLGARFRIASLDSDITSPTGLAGDGEAEDHLLPVLDCGLKLTKTASTTNPGKPTTADTAHPTIKYTFTVTNTGAVPLHNVRLEDKTLQGFTPETIAVLDKGETQTFEAERRLDPAEIQAGVAIKNTATATGTYAGNAEGTADDATLTSTDTATIAVDNTPGLTITKSLDATSMPAVGGQLEYTMVVRNSGNTTVRDVRVDDPLLVGGKAHLRGEPDTFVLPQLAPGEQAVFVGSHTVTQADVDAAKLTNTAIAKGINAADNGEVTKDSSATTPFTAKPGVSLSKSGPATLSADKKTITYGFTVTNTGNVSLTGILFDDALLGLTDQPVLEVSPERPKLAPSESLTFERTYDVTPADLEAGKVTNVASVKATPASGTQATASSNTVETTLEQVPALTLTKEAALSHGDHTATTPESIDRAGDTVTYTFEVTNTGNLALKDLVLTDQMLGKDKAPVGTVTVKGGDRDGQKVDRLLPGETGVFTHAYTVSQDDVDGQTVLKNTATAGGTPVTSVADVEPPVSEPATATVPIESAASFTIDKVVVPGETTPKDHLYTLGESVDYKVTIKNTGHKTLTGMTWSDELLGIDEAAVPAVKPGASETFTRSHTVTQADVDAGHVTNVASAKLPGGEPSTATAEVKTHSESALTLEKTGTPVANATAGGEKPSTITYTLKVTNTGNTTLTDPTVTDPLYADEDGKHTLAVTPEVVDPANPGALKPGGKGTATFTYTVTQADIDAGKVLNTATATAQPPSGAKDPAPAEGKTTTTVTGTPGIEVLKSAEVLEPKPQPGAEPFVAKAGDKILYSVTVTNSGAVTLKDVTATDPMLVSEQNPGGLVPEPAAPVTLAPGAHHTFAFTHTVTQEEIDGGGVSNTATGHALPVTPQAEPLEKESSTHTPAKGAPAISIEKELDSAVPAVPAAGNELTFTLTVTNTGAVTLNDVTAADLPAGVADVVLDKRTLAPGESTTGTVTYKLTQADIDAGTFVNTATTQGTPANGAPQVDAKTGADLTVALPRSPQLTVVKHQAGGEDQRAVGESMTYRIEVKNPGNVTLNDVVVGDNNATITEVTIDGNAIPGETVDGRRTIPALAPGQTAIVSATRTVTQADLDAGTVVNTATASATAGQDPVTAPDSTVTDTALGTPGLSIEKTNTLNGADVTGEGQTIGYTIKVRNSGTTTLSTIVLDDPLGGLKQLVLTDKEGNPRSLAPGEFAEVEASHVLTQEEVDAGTFKNVARATAVPPSAYAQGPQPAASDDDTLTLTGRESLTPSFALKKEFATTPAELSKAGQEIEYTLTITNTGPVTLHAPLITDAKLGLDQAQPRRENVPVTSLAPKESATLTGTWKITQAEVDAGVALNEASATVAVPEAHKDQAPKDQTASAQTPIKGTAGLSLAKTAAVVEAKEATRAGQSIRYTLTVTNTGTTTITDASVADPMAGDTALKVTPSTLAPGQSGVATFDHVITQAEADAGKVFNTATATAKGPGGKELKPTEDTVEVPVKALPQLTLAKSAEPVSGAPLTRAGDVVRYTLTVTNDGDTTLKDARVTDAMLGLKDAEVSPSELLPGASGTVSANYTLTQKDVDAGALRNEATASAAPPRGDRVSDDAQLKTPIAATSGFTVAKTAKVLTDKQVITKAGEEIAYTITLTNQGTTTLRGLTALDPMYGKDNLALSPDPLLPGKSASATFTHVVTQEEIDGGLVRNQASASATPPGTDTPLPPQDSNTVEIVTQGDSSLSLVKSASGQPTRAGQAITYTFTVTNTGHTTLKDVSVADPRVSKDPLPVTPSTLAPGQSGVASVVYEVNQDDVDAGGVTNVATATGLPPRGDAVDSPPSNEVTTPIAPAPALQLSKQGASASGEKLTHAGQKIAYTLTVTNRGNTTLRGATVTDELLGLTDAAVKPSTLAPGESGVLSAAYTLTQADVDAMTVHNKASATATSAGATDPLKPVTATADVPVESNAHLSLTKSVKGPAAGQVSAAGDTIEYTLSVKNDGTRTVEDVLVSDPLLGAKPLVVKPSTLAPGAAGTVTAIYTLTQADIDAGEVLNRATATGTPRGDHTALPPTESNQVTVALTGEARLSLIKERTSEQQPRKAGEVITYRLTLSNTGTLTASDLLIEDSASEEKSVRLEQPLAPQESVTAQFTHVVTQEDVDRGFFDNTAFATGTSPGQGGADPSPIEETASNTVRTPIVGSSAVSVQKEAIGDPKPVKAGDTITYRLSITNAGDTTLRDPQVSDPLFEDGTPHVWSGELAPGATAQDPWEFTYTVTQADADAGRVVNTATGTATPPGAASALPPVASPTVTVPVAAQSKLTVLKEVVGPLDQDGKLVAPTKQGDALIYRFTVKNEGDTTLTAPTVTDAKLGLVNAVVPVKELAPGQEASLEAAYSVTQDDVDAGTVHNQASATAIPPRSEVPLPPVDSNPVDTEVAGTATISLRKEVAAADATAALSAAGQKVLYTLTVRNEGTTTLTQARVSDEMLGVKDAPVKPAVLAPGQSGTATFEYTLTQEDVDRHRVDNAATAAATASEAYPGIPVAQAEASIDVTPVDSLEVVKGYEPLTGRAQAGDVLRFWVDVTNNGTSTQSQVRVKDPLVGEEYKDAGDTPLAPGQTRRVEFEYTLTQEDVDAARVVNTAVASGVPAGSDTPVETPSNEVTVGLNGEAALSVLKQRVGSEPLTRVGEVIEYDITVTNTGSVTLTDARIEDPGADTATVLVPGKLKPGASHTVRVQHTLTQAEVDSGSFSNTATASALPPTPASGEPPARTDTATSNTVDTPLSALSALGVSKKASSKPLKRAGEPIEFTVTLKNTGSTTLTDPTVNDPMSGEGAVVIRRGPLAPGESVQYSFTHRVTQEEVDAGRVTNTATGSAATPSGDVLGEVLSNTTTTPVAGTGRLKVEKSGTPTGAAGTPTEGIEYTVKVTNVGQTTLTRIRVDDPLVGASAVAPERDTLKPGESTTVRFSYVLTDADRAAGVVRNTATASALEPTGQVLGVVASNTVATKVTGGIHVGGVGQERPDGEGGTPGEPGERPDGGGPGTAPGGSGLPGTGAAVTTAVGLGILLLLAGGLALMAIRRRRKG